MSGLRLHVSRPLRAGFIGLLLAAVLLGYPTHSPGAAEAGQSSVDVAVVPGFAPTPYNGNSGVPHLPINAPELAKYNFTELPADSVTSDALKNYDTVIVYGLLWSDIPSDGQAALNAFAMTHKVVIWDSDATEAQSYATFIHPFSTLSSGQSYQGKPSDSVVFIPKGVNFLASPNPASPYYLDPEQLVTDRDELNDMNAMPTGTNNWRPALIAANHGIPAGAWPIAWSYGVIGDHTGLTIYSGLDADAFPTQETLNNDRKELALDLAAPFLSTPAPCAPGCHLPPTGPSNPFASCTFHKISHHWAHGRIPVVLKTSLADGITARILDRFGQVLAKGSEQTGDHVSLVIPTRKLPANQTSRLRVVVLVHGQQACTNRFQVIKDQIRRPRLLLLATTDGLRNRLTLRVGEYVLMKVVAPHLHWITNGVPAQKVVHFSVPASVRKAQLTLRDRAGNTFTWRLSWNSG